MAQGGVGRFGRAGASIAIDGVAGVRLGVSCGLQLDQKDAAIAGAGDLGNEHASVQLAAEVDSHPVLPVGVVGNVLRITEGACGRFQGDQGQAVDVAVLGTGLNEARGVRGIGGTRRRGRSSRGAGRADRGVVPVGVGAQACFQLGVVQVTGHLAEVAGHGRFIVQVADRNLNDGGSARTKALRFTCGNRAAARVVPTLLSSNLQILPATNLLLPLSPQFSVFCFLFSVIAKAPLRGRGSCRAAGKWD